MTNPIYLDNQATTPLDPAVLESMLPYYSDKFGNAASIHHSFGHEAKEAVEKSRKIIAKELNTSAREIVSTSGATEEWSDSYVAAIQSLKKLNEQIAETIIVANMLYTNADSGDIDKILEKINQLKEESLDLVKKSDNLRP